MRRIHKEPVKQVVIFSFALMMWTQTALSAPAPIRYGHGAGEAKAHAPESHEYASLSAPQTNPVREDVFFYPDEPVRLDKQQTSAQIDTVRPAPIPVVTGLAREARPQLAYIEPQDYYSYAKIGTPYTINGVTYYPQEDPGYDRFGTASWYGADFHGGLTANGEIYDMMAMTAAHPTLPLPSYVVVTHQTNGRQVVVRVNDRGPFKDNRIIDLSRAAAERLDMIGAGTADVRVQYLGPAEKAGQAPVLPSVSPDQVIMAENLAPPPNRTAPRPASMDAHFVQLGSFAERTNADSLLRKANAVSPQGDVVFANVNGAKRYRVIMGPFPTRQDADLMLSTMLSNGFDGLIIRNPT